MFRNLCWFGSFLLTISKIGWSDDGSVQVVLEHGFGGREFTRRGFVKITKFPGGDQTAEYVPGEWSKDDQKALLDAAKNGQMYKIRASTRFEVDSISGDAYVMSSTPACFLLRSGLNDVIHLAVESNRQRIMTVSTFPIVRSNEDCSNFLNDDNSISSDEFNTTVRVVDSVDGPIPETQTYLQKVEREKQERQRGEQGDNRSFLAKYWMYIVPVVIVLMLSSAMNPDAQGGGNRQ